MAGFVLRSMTEALAMALNNERPVDWQLRQFFKAQPSLGRRDRGLIAETLFDVLRNRRLYLHLAQSGSGEMVRRLLLLAWSWPERIVTSNSLVQVLPNERSWLEHVLKVDQASLPAALAVSVPDWVFERLAQSSGEAAARAILAALLVGAPLDLRVNPIKAKRDEALAALKAAGIDAAALAMVPSAIRVVGKPALERSQPFEAGWVEVQDAGSQILGYLVSPKRGQIVVDFCAGAGGKSLALAAMMRDSGQLFACDVSLSRLQKLRPRLVRAGLSNIQPFAIDSEADPKLKRLASKADLVLVDAPCSGLGTLRRNPDLKWRWKETDIAELQVKQVKILLAAAKLVKPGGALIYATCSLLHEENEAVCEAFDQQHADWIAEPAPEFLARAGVDLGFLPEADAAGPNQRFLKLRPDLHATDGFFAARWRRP